MICSHDDYLHGTLWGRYVDHVTIDDAVVDVNVPGSRCAVTIDVNGDGLREV